MGAKLTGVLVVGGVVVALVLAGFLSPPPAPPPMVDGWFGRGRIVSADDPSIRPFTINVQEKLLSDLHERLQRARIPEELEDATFTYGFREGYLKDVLTYWQEKYDWRKHEKILNSFPQFLTQIEGIDIHYLHVKPPSGVNTGKKPLILSHGWPGSVWEFYKLIPRLTEPEKYGGRKEDALEVICPSIPGYGYSEAPHQKGFGQAAAARVFVKLMRRLGHEQFYVQGGDWGSIISVIMAIAYPQHVSGVHINMFPIPMKNPILIGHQVLASLAPSIFMDEKDRVLLRQSNNFGDLLQETGYMHIQATKPDTIGTGLNDSPAGLAAYILEKFSRWTNNSYVDLPDGGITKKFTLDELLTNVMIYWTTETITSSVRFYKEYFNDGITIQFDGVPLHVPSGLAAFPGEFVTAPKAFLGYRYKNIVQYTDMPKGGHFAAFEEPKLLADDIFAFIKKLEELDKSK